MTRQTPRDEEDRLPEARDNLPFAAFIAFLYVYLFVFKLHLLCCRFYRSVCF